MSLSERVLLQEFLDAKYDSYIGSLGALLEIGLVCYILIASLVGFYTFNRFRLITSNLLVDKNSNIDPNTKPLLYCLNKLICIPLPTKPR